MNESSDNGMGTCIRTFGSTFCETLVNEAVKVAKTEFLSDFKWELTNQFATISDQM
jgi:hypothetical protein